MIRIKATNAIQHLRPLILIAAAAAVLAAAPSAQATFPANNGLIVFAADTGAGAQLYTVRPDGEDLHQITHVDGEAVNPDWSPDGRRITFELAAADCSSVAFVDADGTDLTELPPTPNVCEGQPSFTPDGKRIVFGRFDGVEEAIWSMTLDGNDRRRITSGPAGATDPNASPDGDALSFVGFNGLDFGQALFTDGIDGGNLFQLTPFTLDVAIKHDWAPNGRRLVLTDNADFPHPGDSANIATIRPDGTNLRYLTHFQGGEVNAFVGSYSPDGCWIVFRFEDHGSYGLYKMRPDGTDVQPILGLSSFRPRFIDWGPRTHARHDDRDDGDDEDGHNGDEGRDHHKKHHDKRHHRRHHRHH